MKERLADVFYKLKTSAVKLYDIILLDEVVTGEKHRFDTLLAWFYLVLHFVLGFWLLSTAYDEISRLDAYSNDFGVKSAFETLYLLLGVIWGNVGWDGYNRIKEGAPRNEIAVRLFKFTMPCIGFTAVAMNLFLAYNRMKEWDVSTSVWLELYYNSVDNTLILSVFFLLIYALLPLVKKHKKKRLKAKLITDESDQESVQLLNELQIAALEAKNNPEGLRAATKPLKN
jgi:uncharacterized membrane protein (DUF485 family)